ncbi:MAG: hypothetical protein C0592_06880, partial [Marinilabiliales bacterium]
MKIVTKTFTPKFIFSYFAKDNLINTFSIMTLEKKYLHKDEITISRNKIVFGVVLGLLFAFSFYSFLYVMREGLRFMSVTDTHDLWVLSDKEVHFYNLIYAFISVIFAQSVILTFYFDRPKKFFWKRNFRRLSIVNDQRVLNWYFLSWFSKLAILFAFLFGLVFNSGFYSFSFYPDYNYLFILMVIVLFFQTWTTIRIVYKQSLKWMLYSFVLVCIVAFGLSRVNLIDYKAINQTVLQKNIDFNYDLELPESSCYERLDRLNLIENIYLVKEKESPDNSAPILVVDDEEIRLDMLHTKIQEWRSMRNEIDRQYIIYQLHIHKAVKMEFVHQLKQELSNQGAVNIAYAVAPNDRKLDKKCYHNFAFPIKLPDWSNERLSLKEAYEDTYTYQNIIDIQQLESGCFINDSLMMPNQVKNLVKEKISHNTDYIIRLMVSDDIVFADYFIVLSSIKEAIDDLRNEFAMKKYEKE